MLLIGSILLLLVSLYKYMFQEEEKILFDAVLVFFIKDGKVLLPMKMKKIGKGLLNGYGGGIEEDETPLEAAVRESKEEGKVLVRPEYLKKRGEILFHNITKDGKKFTCKVYVYTAAMWEGDFVSTEEMADPTWYPISDVPLEKFMLADPFWLPQVLSGKSVHGEVWYGPEQKSLLQGPEIAEASFLSEGLKDRRIVGLYFVFR